MKPSDLKSTLKSGGAVFGFMLSVAQSMRWNRFLEGSTLDYVVIDTEHGSRDRYEIASVINMCRAANVTTIVRTPNTDPVYVAMALDAGADGVLVPYCETVEEVRACAATLRLHPLKGEYLQRAINKGVFPSDKSRDYLQGRHKSHIFIMGIESEPAFKRLDDLLECAEIDGIFVGPNDLTTSLGIPDEVDNPKYLETLQAIIRMGEAKGVPTMVHQQAPKPSCRAIEMGARFVLHSSDAGILLRATQSEFAELRKVAATRFGKGRAVKAEDTLETV